MDLTIKECHLTIVLDILNKYPHSFYGFGSRIRGNAKRLSDLDLCFMEPISRKILGRLEEDFEESDLPFKVDVGDYQSFNQNFKKIIQPDLMLIKKGPDYTPNPHVTYPIPFCKRTCFLKNIIDNPNIIVGDYTYYDDPQDVQNFKKNVLYHFDFIGDKLIFGKFCQIATGVTFLMNGGNHELDKESTYPFKVFGWDKPLNPISKGDTVIGNDVWLGYRATIMPGITIGDGAIISAKAVVTKDVSPYTIVGGNPARILRERFSKEQIPSKWWLGSI